MLVVVLTGDGKTSTDAMKPGDAINSNRYTEFVHVQQDLDNFGGNTATQDHTLRRLLVDFSREEAFS